MNAQPAFTFRWRSLLGVSVALFLAWGALNAFMAVFVPVSLHRNGAGALGGALVLGAEEDAALLGRPLTVIAQDDPKLNAFLVSFMDNLSALLMAYAIVHLGVVWFALRRGQAWALWFVGATALVSILYSVPVMLTYARFAVPVGNSLLGIAISSMIVLVATALGWFGLRRAQRQRPAAA